MQNALLSKQRQCLFEKIAESLKLTYELGVTRRQLELQPKETSADFDRAGHQMFGESSERLSKAKPLAGGYGRREQLGLPEVELVHELSISTPWTDHATLPSFGGRCPGEDSRLVCACAPSGAYL